MKAVWIWSLCVFLGGATSAQTNWGTIIATNSSGQVFTNAEVFKVDAVYLFYRVPGGGGRVRLATLGAADRERFHYDAAIEKESLQKAARKEADQREARETELQALNCQYDFARKRKAAEANALGIYAHVIRIREEGLIVMVGSNEFTEYAVTTNYLAFKEKHPKLPEVAHKGLALLTVLPKDRKYYVGDDLAVIGWATGDFDNHGERIRKYTCDLDVAASFEK